MEWDGAGEASETRCLNSNKANFYPISRQGWVNVGEWGGQTFSTKH